MDVEKLINVMRRLRIYNIIKNFIGRLIVFLYVNI